MRELCGTAAEYLGCHTPPYEVESGGEELRFEGGLLKIFAPIPGIGAEAYLSPVGISVLQFTL